MKIEARIAEVKYKALNCIKLDKITFPELNINKAPASFLLANGNSNYGVSKWISPKRTRSYPFARVYDTLSTSKRIAIIPVVKDEGKNGERDFVQWDTISLMSLLDVYVVLAYYNDAKRYGSRANKIKGQLFDNYFIMAKIQQIESYQSSALHWNINEIKKNLPNLIEKVLQGYRNISEQFNVEFHSEKGIDRFQKQFKEGVECFMNSSRERASRAQARESITTQPKEFLETLSKGTITITNYLGGKYFLTTDQVEVINDQIFLIESKNSRSKILPSITDIKDGLIKMVLYANLAEVSINGIQFKPKPVLRLTSSKLHGNISSADEDELITGFSERNMLSARSREQIKSLFREARENNFSINVKGQES